MFVFESGLDALAFAEHTTPQSDAIYVSTGGGFGPISEVALRDLAEGKDVFSGFDNDAGGEQLDKALRSIIPGAERMAPPSRVEGTECVCKDWLDVLNAAKSVAMDRSSGLGPDVGVGDQTSEQPEDDYDGPAFG